MTIGMEYLLFFWVFYSIAAILAGWHFAVRKNLSFYPSRYFLLLGAFVWIDAVILGIFWLITALIFLIIEDWRLWMITVSSFWLIRSLGEIHYWLLQQFAAKPLDDPHKYWMSQYFRGKAVWIYYQVTWQVMAVTSLVSLIYFIYFNR